MCHSNTNNKCHNKRLIIQHIINNNQLNNKYMSNHNFNIVDK